MRRKATIGGPDKNETTVRPAERGASGYRRFGARTAHAAGTNPGTTAGTTPGTALGSASGRFDGAVTGLPARVATAAGVATVVALGGATFAPLADAQPAPSATPTGSHEGRGSLATAEADHGSDDDVLSLLDLRRDDRDERELLRRLMALAQVIVTAIVDGQLPTQAEGTGEVVVPDDQLVEALAQLRALAEALAAGPADAAPAPTTVPEASAAPVAPETTTPDPDDAAADPADDPVAPTDDSTDAADPTTDDTPATEEVDAPAPTSEAAPAGDEADDGGDEVDDSPSAAMAPASTDDQSGDTVAAADDGTAGDPDGTDHDGDRQEALDRREGRGAIEGAEARQAATREAADEAGRKIAGQAGAGFGGCDDVPQPDSVGQDGGRTGPASTPPPATEAPAAPAAPVSLPATDAPAVPATPAPSSAEAEFLSLLNEERAKVGLPALALDGGLQAAAAAQAANIASAGSLFHQDLVPLLGPWRTVGENVGFGPSVGSINTALVNSPGHYANMVNPDFTHVGIGVVVTSDGRVWVSQVFGG